MRTVSTSGYWRLCSHLQKRIKSPQLTVELHLLSMFRLGIFGLTPIARVVFEQPKSSDILLKFANIGLSTYA